MHNVGFINMTRFFNWSAEREVQMGKEMQRTCQHARMILGVGKLKANDESLLNGCTCPPHFSEVKRDFSSANQFRASLPILSNRSAALDFIPSALE